MTNEPTDPLQRVSAALDELRAAIPLMGQELTTEMSRRRGDLNGQLWVAQRALGLVSGYFSEAGQDMAFDSHIFKGKRGGTFVEIGGHDGVTGSVGLFFELRRGWSGLLVEAVPELCAQAASFRACPCLNAVVGPKDGAAEFATVGGWAAQMSGLRDLWPEEFRTAEAEGRLGEVETRQVATRSLDAILTEAGLTEIDLLAIDVEGAEPAILREFPFENYTIRAICVENLARNDALGEILVPKGFVLIDFVGKDELYVHSSVDVSF